MLTIFLLLGCDALDSDVAEAFVVGVDAPEVIDLSGTGWSRGANVAAWFGTIAGRPVDVAMSASSPTNGDVALEDAGEGNWKAPDNAELDYVVGEIWTIARDGDVVLQTEAAPTANVSIPETHPAGAALPIDADDADFDMLLGIVLDLETGEEVWSNLPAGAKAAADLLIGPPELAFDIPGEAFRPGTYAVGVGGLRTNEPVDATDVNSLVSILATGAVRFEAVTVE